MSTDSSLLQKTQNAICNLKQSLFRLSLSKNKCLPKEQQNQQKTTDSDIVDNTENIENSYYSNVDDQDTNVEDEDFYYNEKYQQIPIFTDMSQELKFITTNYNSNLCPQSMQSLSEANLGAHRPRSYSESDISFYTLSGKREILQKSLLDGYPTQLVPVSQGEYAIVRGRFTISRNTVASSHWSPSRPSAISRFKNVD